ncbi:MBL fold metallo-hydrolase [Dactylosporangium sp. NPDC000555]|uniref:MBL fold metallo-hydrolase n=1 Tax=Dactylosporangium sp. NPDC000555 TaxID=3154260 RepID=UPI003322A0AC
MHKGDGPRGDVLSAAWTEPGAFEEAPGVHRIPLPLPLDGLRAVNVYALAAADGLVLIDAGWAVPESRARLVGALDGLGHAPADIRRFLVTHVHRDHYTQAVALRREFGTRISLGAGERATIEHAHDPSRPALEGQLRTLAQMGAQDLVREIAAHMPADAPPDQRGLWEAPDDWFDGQETLQVAGRALTVLPTPGHTNGHVVFHDEAAGVLFAGDHVLPGITPSIGFDVAIAPNPLRDYLGSLALVRSRPDALLLPAHGPAAPSVHRRVDELVEHHGARLEQTEKAVARGAETGLEIAARLPWTRRERRFDDLDLFNRMLAVCETAAHLELLVSQGRLHAERDPSPDGPVRRFRTA